MAPRPRRPRHHRLPRGREPLSRRVVRRRTPTWSRRSSARSSRACRRPTCRPRSARATGGTSPAPRRARATPSTAAAAAPRPPPSRCCSTRTSKPASHDYFAVGTFDVNPQHTLLAWSSDTDGSERYTMRFRDLATGTDLPDVLVGHHVGRHGLVGRRHARCSTSPPDEQMRPFCVWRHRAGHAQSDDVLVLRGARRALLRRTSTSAAASEWIVIETASKVSGEVRLLPADRPDRRSRCWSATARSTSSTALDHWGDRWVVLTNLDAERLPRDDRTARPTRPTGPSWCRTCPGGASSPSSRSPTTWWCTSGRDAQPRLRVLFRDGTERRAATSATSRTTSNSTRTPSGMPRTVRYANQSLTTPATVFEEDVRTGERRAAEADARPRTSTSRSTPASALWATAPDGTARAGRHRAPPRHRGRRHRAAGSCTATAATRRRCRRGSASAASRCSTVAWSWALVHPRGGGELGRAGTSRASSSTSATRSPTPSPRVEHLVDSGWGAPANGVASAAAAPAACWSAPASPCAPTCSAPRWPRCRSSTSSPR